MAKTLMEELKSAGSAGICVRRCLKEVGITRYEQLDKHAFFVIRDHITKKVSSSSARTYFATLCAILNRVNESEKIPCMTYAKILKAKEDKPIKIYLNDSEVERIASVETHSKVEKYVQSAFFVSSKTGMRVSDTLAITIENIFDGYLTYSSQKTHIIASIPVSERIVNAIKYIQKHEQKITLMSYNRILKMLGERAGLTENVKIHKGGKNLIMRKCDCISSHTGRISFATNLIDCGMSLVDVSKMCGHTTTSQTERYIQKRAITLNDKAKEYLLK